ncbi:MAG TPA: gliding motility-associated C-terminal domain-containing protein, partial [Chitinophagaceae bacterium]|nr:gliding motility-associated C-terminal domain-containing protein [Chitinophagaceae bacterium]
VSVTDNCGNVLRDTITVVAPMPAPFDLGPDSSLCEKDSILLKAPEAFTNYSWSPAYRISSLSTANVFVFPLTDTVYHVRAESTAGCLVEDSVHIAVKHGQPVHLGADKSFCSGDSAVLDAGTDFNTYAWSNGTTGQFTTVYTTGIYSVVATGQNVCKSFDTVRILNVFANPRPDLGTDSVICAGTLRIINAGVYSQYTWNTGSITSTISVTETGLYSVEVTDNNNCKGYDTLVISKKINPPSGFLPPDTSLCTYGKIELKTKGSYNNYLWSTGASSSTISIENAGTYWLEVKDKDNCVGRDSILIISGNCGSGFYIPNAFTPGHDGKNDVFRPLIFGNLLQYEFTVYNRYGQVVFSSKQPGKGWDGATQTTGGFAWTCRYQLENQSLKIEKGIVLLLK